MFEIEYGGELNLPCVYDVFKKIIELFELNGLEIKNTTNAKIRLTDGPTPITYYTRDYIDLTPNSPAYYLDQIAYQFAHELTHFVSHSYKLPAKIQWFDELLAANIGLLALAKLGSTSYYKLNAQRARKLSSMRDYLVYIKSNLFFFETEPTLVYKSPHYLDAMFLSFFEPWTLLSIFKNHVFDISADKDIDMSEIFKAMLSDTQPNSPEFSFLTLAQTILYPA